MASNLKSFLNIFSIGLCGFAKIPQIKTNWKARSTDGLSLPSLLLEIVSSTISFCYYAYHGYPLGDFLEYPLLLGQSAFLVYLCISLKDPHAYSRNQLLVMNFSYIAFVAVLSSPYVFSPNVIETLMRLSLPISPASKVLQILKIIETGRGDLISKAPWAIYAATSFARIITVVMETGDLNLISAYSMSVFLNIAVICTASIYSNSSNTKEKKLN